MDQEKYEQAIQLRIRQENAMRLKAAIEADLDICSQVKSGMVITEVKRQNEHLPIFPVIACLEQYEGTMSLESILVLLDAALVSVNLRLDQIKEAVEAL